MREKKFILTNLLVIGLGILLPGAWTGAAKDLTISPSTVPNGQYGTAYKQTLKASGGIGPVTFSVTAGNLPSGISLSTDGVLSGTPTGAGAYSFTVTATSSSLLNTISGSRAYTLVIDPASLAVTANNATITYGGILPTLTASYSGFVNGDNPSSLTTQATVTTTGSSASPVGNYPITASGAGSTSCSV